MPNINSRTVIRALVDLDFDEKEVSVYDVARYLAVKIEVVDPLIDELKDARIVRSSRGHIRPWGVLMAEKHSLDFSVEDNASDKAAGAAEALRRLEEAIPKENIELKGPKVPEQHKVKKARLVARDSKRANRPAKPTRRKSRAKVAPRPRRGS